ncbi:hypothetical protein NLG97_g5309 [Lecanicillium saksenae]|uniref:Uncharacterized protein n=1 Tax=Lecanicillium saksenae TaxID=468837 RepID=A0ACC1QT09_9HYPO|nr:hypothetical protein NLG97_g5309 [Lecanicillium saksenae]
MDNECINDGSLGPAVQGCRGDFDFTQKFEQVVFSLIPTAAFLVLSGALVYRQAGRPRLVSGAYFQLIKIGAIAIYTATQLALLVLAIVADVGPSQELFIASQALSFTAGLVMILVSFLEHARSRRTSALLNFYVFLTLLFDIVRARTLWLSAQNHLEDVFARVFTVSIGLKALVLALETRNKERWITWNGEHSPEETSGIFGLAVLSWLKQLFLRGFRGTLQFQDLYGLDRALSAEVATSKLMGALKDTRRGKKSVSLFRALLIAFKWEFLAPVLPQLALIGFQFSQSFFLLALIRYVGLGDEAPSNQGYGLIGACVLVYIGMATSSSYYGYYKERAVCMVRACLCTAIYQKTTEVTTAVANDGTPLTLMSNDVESVELGIDDLHLMWSSVVKVSIGSALLYTKIGLPFMTPIVVIFLCTIVLFCAMTLAGARRAAWMKRIETRVSQTATAIASMKYYKMLGISESVAERLHGLRLVEIQAGTKFRYILLSAFVLSYIPTAASPVITFALTSRSIDAATLFVSLSFIGLTTSPLSSLFQGIPTIISAFTSLHRIEAYLTSKSREDFRIEPTSTDGQMESSPPSRGEEAISAASSLAQQPVFDISNASFGWNGKAVLKDVNLTILRSQLCMVIGPIGSGKTTLCRALLGELSMALGSTKIGYSGKSTGYCAQSPSLSDTTVKENIVGFSPFDQKKYDSVIHATMLNTDLDVLPKGQNTKIGSNGIVLSGGQKQRVALARALFAEADVMIFDDIFSGLDANTETEVFSRVFGSNGILRKRGTTVILSTHSVRHIPRADHIIVLGNEGTIVEQGSFDVLSAGGKYVADLSLQADDVAVEKNEEDEKSSAVPMPSRAEDARAEAEMLKRPASDWSVYVHYLQNITKTSSITFGLLCVVAGASTNFSTIWLSYWSEDTFHHSRSFYVGLYGLIAAVQILSSAVGAKIGMVDIVASSAANLHKSVITTVSKAPLALFTSTDTGAITNLFSQDTMLVDGELPLAFINTGAALAVLLGNFFVVATASPYLIISYPFILALLFSLQMFYLRTSRQLRLLDLEAKSPLYTHYIDTQSGLATIRAFGWEEHEKERNRSLLNASQRPKYLLAMIQIWLQTNLTLLVGVIAVILTALATQLKTGTGFTGASLVTLMSLTGSINQLMRNYAELETSIGAVNRIRMFSSTIKPEDEGDEDSPVPEAWPSQCDFQLDSVSATYSTKDDTEAQDSAAEKPTALAINNISLSIPRGQRVAICGRTGSGKSSLMLLLLRLLNPLASSPDLTIDGLPLSRINRTTLRQRIIVVPQEVVFLPGLNSIKSNLDPLGLATGEECLAVLRAVGLSEFVDGLGGTDTPMAADSLSAGQQQLFSLARAVLRRRVKDRSFGPSHGGGVLLLDEMNSKLDDDTDRVMQQIVRQEFEGYTIIMIAHRLDIVVNMCDRVLVMEKGSVVEDGGPKALIATENSQFSELWKENSR